MRIFRTRAKQQAIIDQTKNLYNNLTPISKPRVVTAVRKCFLLNYVDDPYFYNGNAYVVKWKSLGSGVWEVRLEPKP